MTATKSGKLVGLPIFAIFGDCHLFSPPALGTSERRDGPYGRQALAAGVTSVLVPGSGGVLGTVWLVAVEVKAHLMPALLWGLLIQEGITGTPTRDTLGYDSSRF